MGDINLNHTEHEEPHPDTPYFLAFLGFLPSIGFPAGLALFFYGIFEKKSKKLIIAGLTCMLLSALIYTSINRLDLKSTIVLRVGERQAQSRLNYLTDNIEQYKMLKGHYPDDLQELTEQNQTILIDDPMVPAANGGVINFNYENLGFGYSIYSAGKDGIPDTRDDMFPKLNQRAAKQVK